MRKRLVFVLFLAACHKTNAAPQDASPSPSASVSQQAVTEQASIDRHWVDARDGDALELARLADAVGADDLADVAVDAKKDEADRRTAVRALAYVDDPTPALDALARVAASGGELGSIALDTIATLAPKRSPMEEEEPTAWRACAQALLVASPMLHDAELRKRLISALIALSDRGVVDASAIPAE